MGPRPAHVVTGIGSNRHHAVPLTRWRAWAGMLALAAAAGLTVLPGTMTGTPTARAAAAVPAQAAAATYSQPAFEPCPCTSPLCKAGCSPV
jgi:hypothetical protein